MVHDMKNPLNYFGILARRWAWLVLLGVLICGGATYIVSNLITPTYEATATLFVKVCTPSSSANDCLSASTAAVPTYAQLLTNPTVLEPVVVQHPDMTLNQLTSMINVKPQSNTQLIELNVDNADPQLAAQLADQVGESFAGYVNIELPASANIRVLPANLPINPIKPKTLEYTAIGALVGLALAIALIVLFEWVDDRLVRPEEVQLLLGIETLVAIPKLARRQRNRNVEAMPALLEKYRLLTARLEAAQAIKPFRLLMVTSPLTGEGKSTVAANLATCLAVAGRRVLLVDTNLRRPVQDVHFQLDNRDGLASVLLCMQAQMDVDLDGQATSIPGLFVLTSGGPLSNATEVLQSTLVDQFLESLKKSRFDYIIFDAPPLLPVADAQILAAKVQTMLLVIDADKTPRRVLTRVKNILKASHDSVLGVILNKSRWSDYNDERLFVGGAKLPGLDLSQPLIPEKSGEESEMEVNRGNDATIILPRRNRQ
jgi:capsular exopolysaccharide synthesis family protein